MPKSKSLDQFAVERETERLTANAEIQRSNRALRSAVDQKDKVMADMSKRLGLYERLDEQRLTPPTWLTPKAAGKHVGIPSMLLTDIHWDEVVRPEQIDGLNKYNRAIAEARVKRAFEHAVVLPRDYLSGIHWDGFSLKLGGDLLSGIIHEELRETNEAQIMESILSLLDPLLAGIHLLAKSYPKVHVSCVVGNHGRNTRKPRAKNRPQENFDWLIYKLIERELRGHKTVTVQVADGADTQVQLYGTRYLLTHGDQFSGGSGISGLLAPLLLGTARKTRRQAMAGKPYDIMVLGHFHQSVTLPSKGIIVGGSVVGYSEYGYINNLEPEPPQCAFWVTTPEWGVTFSAPVFVCDRESEGW